MDLPAGLNYSGDFALLRQFAETNAAQIKIAHITADAAAAPAPPHFAGGKFGRPFGSCDLTLFCHKIS
jgi:hypothetical protein